MNRNARLLIASVFITDIGNGMFNLALASLLYLETKSVLAFAVVLSSEFVIGLLMQLLAGSVVDRGDPKKTMVLVDAIRGSCLAIAAVAYTLGAGLWPLYLALVIINVVKPFYKSAQFSLTPNIVPEEGIVRLISLRGSASQAGQLLGVALAAPLLAWAGSVAALLVDSLSFYGSALMVLLIAQGAIEKKIDQKGGALSFLTDWREIAGLLWKRPSALLLILLASGDLLFVALINLFLVPLNKAVADNPFHLSLMDGAFAVGALGMGVLADQIITAIGNRKAVVQALLVQALCFCVLAVSRNILVLMAVMALLGAGNTLSIAVFFSSLQIRTKGAIKGRISAFRQILVSIIVSLVLPGFATIINSRGIQTAALAAGGVVAVYLLLTLAATSRSLYRGGFFIDRIELDPAVGSAVPATH